MKKSNPWYWVPTLYFAEGIPYFIVNVISVTMFKRLGMGNGELAMYTSLLYLPWVIKPFWSPLVDVFKTKRWWILCTQFAMVALFGALALSVNPGVFGWSLVFFYLTAFASATHDIAADGFYMLALDSHEQSVFVGIRSTFYRISSVFGQGVIVVAAGLLEEKTGNIPLAWTITLAACSLLFAVLSMWHCRFLPAVEGSSQPAGRGIIDSFGSFFKKKGVWLAIVFMLLYRLPEAFSIKMLSPFMLDGPEAGGLGLSTAQSGLVYGTVGVIALTLGGIVGGLAAAAGGLRKMIWPMALSLALPCAAYLFLAAARPTSLPVIYACVAFDQFGYGFGFTAYMLYMMYFSEGRYKTSHYAICTAFMALSMMLPGLVAGWIQESVGYVGFFVIVMICCLCTIAVTAFARKTIDPEYGMKK